MFIAVVNYFDLIRRLDIEPPHRFLRETRHCDDLRGAASKSRYKNAIDCSEHQAIALWRNPAIEVMNADDLPFQGERAGVAQTQEAPPNIAGQDELLPEVAGCVWRQPHGNV